MSMPFVNFQCSECDFSASSTVIWGRCSYEVSGQIVPIARTLGWCGSCESFSPVEVLPTADRLALLQSRLRETEHYVLGERLRLIGERPWYKRLFNTKVTLPDAAAKAESLTVSLRRDIEAEELRGRLLAARCGPARCLRCGGVELEEVPRDVNLYPPDGAMPTALGFRHPGCGGEIAAVPSQFRVAVRLMHRIFDSEGLFLREETSRR